MSRVKTIAWMTAFSLAALTSAAHGDSTQAEIRRLQSELDQLKSRLGDEPTDPALNWPSLKVFGSVSVDAIYDDFIAALAAEGGATLDASIKSIFAASIAG